MNKKMKKKMMVPKKSIGPKAKDMMDQKSMDLDDKNPKLAKMVAKKVRAR